MPKKISLTILFICLFVLSTFGQTKSNPLLEMYLTRLVNCPSEGSGMSRQEVAIADSIKSIGAEAIPSLIKLLKHSDYKVRERASFIISEIDGINITHLDALIKSLRNGQSWHANRIAEIGTPLAIEALVKELIKDCETETQITNSFKILGAKGVPYLFNIIDCKNNCNEDLLYVVSTIFKELGSDAKDVVNKLDSIALSNKNSTLSRKWAIICLGNIGESANSTAKDIYELSLQYPDNFKKVSTDALQNMQSIYAIQPLLERLNSSKTEREKILVLRDIAEMHEKGKLAGNAIVPYLNNENWDLRIAAAITLGYIDYTPASDSLIKTLNFEPDCRLNFVSAIALGKLKFKSSLQQLNWAKENHWNPIVRKAAKNAIQQIEDTTFITRTKKYYSFGEEFFSYEIDAMMYPWCDLDSCIDEKEFKLPTGLLLCTDQGEFGGNLKFIDNNGSENILSRDNFKSIYKLDNNLIAIAGLSHMNFNSGSIYQINIENAGSYSVKRILALPGAPFESKKNHNGNILINTYGGTIELTKDLKLISIECNH